MKAFRTPKTETELAAIQRLAYDHARRFEYKEALQICNSLIEDDLTAAAGYRERAAVRTHMGLTADAIDDMRTLFGLFNQEPADHHTMGLLLLQNGDNQEAAKMFSQAVELGAAVDFFYYTESAQLFGAAAYLRSGDYPEARDLASTLPDGTEGYAPGLGMFSKELILAEVTRAMSSRPA